MDNSQASKITMLFAPGSLLLGLYLKEIIIINQCYSDCALGTPKTAFLHLSQPDLHSSLIYQPSKMLENFFLGSRQPLISVYFISKSILVKLNFNPEFLCCSGSTFTHKVSSSLSPELWVPIKNKKVGESRLWIRATHLSLGLEFCWFRSLNSLFQTLNCRQFYFLKNCLLGS